MRRPKIFPFGMIVVIQSNYQPTEAEQSFRPDATDVPLSTSTISQTSIQDYQSIMPLAGKYANAPFLRNLSEFLEQYDKEIDELNKE